MSTLLLLLTHLAASAVGAVIAHRATVRNLTIREVDGETLMAFTHEKRPAPAAVAWVALVASLVVFLIGAQALVATRAVLEDTRTALDRTDRNRDAIVALECDQAWFWLSLLDRRDPTEPQTDEERETRKEFRARQLDVIEDLECPPPVEATTDEMR